MNRRGRFIVIEGLDGTGKSTLASSLAVRLGAVSLSTPGAAWRRVRPLVDEIYRDAPVAAQLFYASTVVAAGAQAQVHLQSGRDVVCDRYWLSTWVYAPVRGAHVDLDAVEAMLPAADVTLLCEVAETVRCERLRRRGATAADRQTLAPGCAAVLGRRYRTALLRPVAGRGVVLDLTGTDPDSSVEVALRALPPVRMPRAA